MTPDRSSAGRRAGTVAAALVALLAPALVGGCSSAGGANPPHGGAGPDTAVDVNPAPRDLIPEGGTLRWAIDELPTQWNVNELDGGDGATSDIVGALLPTMFGTDAAGVPAVNHDYLLSAEVTARSPRQVVTYRLNPKAAWSDGTPLTWKDFLIQAQALSGRNAAFQIGSATGYDQIASVAGSSGRSAAAGGAGASAGSSGDEVVVTFKRPFAEWQQLFSPLYPVATNTSPRAFNTGWVDRIPVSAGPFKLDRIDQTAKTVTLARDPAWWGAPAKLDRIIFRTLDGTAAASAFASGEIDAFDIGPDPDSYRRAAGAPGGSVREAAGLADRNFTLNATSPLLSDIAVRQAVALALDRQAIAHSDLVGLTWPAVPMNNHFFVPTQAGYRDGTGELGRYNPPRAGRLLDAAGWRRPAAATGTVRRKNGKPLVLRFVIPAGTDLAMREGQLAQAMLRQVGITLRIQAVPQDDFLPKYVTTGNFDLAPLSWQGGAYPISSLRSIYAQPTKGADGTPQIQQNYARIGSAHLDALMDQAAAELDPVKARDDLNQADALVWAEVHSLVLFQRPQIFAAKANLANFGAFGLQTPRFEDIGFTRP